MRSSVLALAVVTAFAVTTGIGFAQESTPESVPDERTGTQAAPPAAPLPDLPPMPAPPTLPPDGSKPQINAAHVELAATRGQRASGRLQLSPDNFGLRITGRVTGLNNNGRQGFHVHEVGNCGGNDAAAAGDHFDPQGSSHGVPSSPDAHAGDLPNLDADPRGNVDIDIHVARLTIGDEGEFDILGRSIVVHAEADDYRSQPAGGSGARIACGVIVATSAPELARPAAGNGNGGNNRGR